MLAQSRTLLFGLSSLVAVGAIGSISYRIADQNPRLFNRVEAPQTSIEAAPTLAEPVAPAEPDATLALKGPSVGNATGGASITSAAVFDIVRVEPTGDTVVAGRAKPGATVRLLNKGVVIAQVTADSNGQFALVPPALAVGDHLLSLEIDGGAASALSQTVAVSVPAERAGDLVVALTQAGAPTQILSERVPASAAPISIALSIRTVEVDDKGGFYATGTGTPGSTILLSLNGAPVISVTANPEGRWSLKVERGMAPGAYSVRADHLDAAGRILAQAEVPFDYPARPVPPPVKEVKGSGSVSDAVVTDLQSVSVQRGDSLWKISQRLLGDGHRYTQIYAANQTQIRKPSLIFPNQILVVPAGTTRP